MDAEALARLSVAELVQVVLDHQRLIERLQARIAELETRLGPPPKTPGNSSVPPSQGRKPNKPPAPPGAAKRGPPAGHPGRTRPAVVPDVRLALRVEACQRCGTDLRGSPQEPVERRQVVEMPPVRPTSVEAVAHQVSCPTCGQAHTAPFPAAFPAPVSFGPRVQAAGAYLHEIQHLPDGRLQRVLSQLWGLPLALGSLVNLVRRTGAALAAPAEAIRQQLGASPVLGSDETPMRVDGRNRWLWVLQTPQASYYVSVPTRGAQVISDVLGTAAPEVWVSDLWSAQQKAPARRFQLCLAHQLRDLQFARECNDTRFAPAMQELLQATLALAAARPQLAPVVYERLRQVIELACDRLLATDTPNAEGARLQRRYRQHRDKLFVCLERPEVPPTNKASERALRNSVVHRKVTGGFRSDWAPRAYTTITTVIETAKKQGQDLFATLLAALDRTIPAATGPPIATY